MGEIELVCSGVNTLLFCVPVHGVKLDKTGIKLPPQYKDWEIEKAVYSPADDKIYVQVRYHNIVQVVTL